MECLLAGLKTFDDCEMIEITYKPANAQARQLYLHLGFVESGESDDSEAIALLHCRPIEANLL